MVGRTRSATLNAGTDFAIDVKVTNQSGKLIKNIVDSLGAPSGWEILDRPLKAKVAGVDLKDIRDDRVHYILCVASRQDKVFQSKGTCCLSRTLLPALGSSRAMYDASAFGQSAADFVEVLKPSDAF